VPKQVIFRLLRDDEILFETQMAPLDFKDPADERRALTISSVAQLVGFVVTQQCVLKARAIVDGKELRGGGLELLAAG
jgi:hypothetical protein